MNLFTLGKSYINNNRNYLNDNPVVFYESKINFLSVIRKISFFIILTAATALFLYFVAVFNSVTAIKNIKIIFINFVSIAPICLVVYFGSLFLNKPKFYEHLGDTIFYFNDKTSVVINGVKYAPILFKVKDSYYYCYSDDFEYQLLSKNGNEYTSLSIDCSYLIIKFKNYLNFDSDCVSISIKINSKSFDTIRTLLEHLNAIKYPSFEKIKK